MAEHKVQETLHFRYPTKLLVKRCVLGIQSSGKKLEVWTIGVTPICLEDGQTKPL